MMKRYIYIFINKGGVDFMAGLTDQENQAAAFGEERKDVKEENNNNKFKDSAEHEMQKYRDNLKKKK